MSDITLKDQYYLTREKYNTLKAAGELVVGGQYYITDEGGGISPGTTATQVPVWDGTEWINQTGYAYEEVGDNIFAAEALEGTYDETVQAYKYTQTESTVSLIIGKTYQVTYNNTVYVIVCIATDTKPSLGSHTSTGFTTYPFFVSIDDTTLEIIYQDENASFKIDSITTHSIASRLLPGFDTMLVNLTQDETTEEISADKTYAQIKAASDADITKIYAHLLSRWYILNISESSTSFVFDCIEYIHSTTDKIKNYQLTVNSSDEWTYTTNLEGTLIPSGGVPKNLLVQTVQESLDKAETALQSFSPLTIADITNTAGKTLSTLREQSGVVSADFQDISVTANQVSGLATVATSGSYSDLDNTPVRAGAQVDGGAADKAECVSVITTAPDSENVGSLKFVVLTNEPTTKYSGYMYIITE